MEDRDKKLLKTYAENNMSMKKTSGAVYLHYNSIRYRFRLIQREYKPALDCRNPEAKLIRFPDRYPNAKKIKYGR